MTVCCANIVKAIYGSGKVSISKKEKAFIALGDGSVRVIDLNGKRHLEKIQLVLSSELCLVHAI